MRDSTQPKSQNQTADISWRNTIRFCLSTLTAFLILTFGQNARAFYRAYELLIEDTEKGTNRTVYSSMDHLQYPRYYPLAKNEVIRYVDSWRCRENMSFFKPTCKKPDWAPPSSQTTQAPQ